MGQFIATMTFLHNRVKFKGTRTDLCGTPAEIWTVNCKGAPQGTVLSPLLFT